MKIKTILFSLFDFEIQEEVFSLSICVVGIKRYNCDYKYKSLFHIGWHNGWVNFELFGFDLL